MKRSTIRFLEGIVFAAFFTATGWIYSQNGADAGGGGFVRVSPRDNRYFELSNGEPYIPIGLNMTGPPSGGDLDDMATWMRNLSANGGNFIRVWLACPFFDVEHARSGEYDERRARRIDRLLDLAARYNIRVKMCIENFRHFGTRRQSWSSKPSHLMAKGGPARDIADFFDGERSREQFRGKLRWYANRYGGNPTIFGWELWNEINAVAGGDYMEWTEVMLVELHRLFPRNLAMQSLGSFDHSAKRSVYRRLSLMDGNDVAQVHRYLDLGANLEVCKGPVDVLAAEAVRELRACKPGKPIILAESGAVEPGHTGPFKLYDKDKAGMILHDVLFAPFFAGAAGPGHIWHWDRYVDNMGLWYHFGRFAETVRGIDPPAEGFEPDLLEQRGLRVYVLKGKHTILVWCRDTFNDWQSELARGNRPREIRSASVDLSRIVSSYNKTRARAYDPWENNWSEARMDGGTVFLPAFRRSIVIRIDQLQDAKP